MDVNVLEFSFISSLISLSSVFYVCLVSAFNVKASLGYLVVLWLTIFKEILMGVVSGYNLPIYGTHRPME